MTRTLIQAPKTAQRGQVIDISALIGHPMETGLRVGADGQLLRQDLIRRFSCHYNGELVFSAELFAALSANPYIAFSTVAVDSGTLVLRWEGDLGFVHSETLALSVT